METKPQIILTKKDGTPVELTVKPPTIRNDREFRAASRARNNAPNIYKACNTEAAAVSDAIGALEKKLAETTAAKTADANAVGKLRDEIAKGEANLADLEKRMQEADAESYERFCRHAWSILEPAKEGIKVEFKDIDWDLADMQQLNGAISFFRQSSRTS